MGGSAPRYSAPQIVMPKPTAPQQYRTVVPQESYRDLRGFGQRLDAQTEALAQERRAEVGTAAELGERMRAREATERAAYLASLPGQMKDPGFLGLQKTAGGSLASQQASQTFQPGTLGEAISTSKTGLTAAQEALKKATAAKAQKDPSIIDPTKFDPSWAKRSDDVYAMKNLGETKKA